MADIDFASAVNSYYSKVLYHCLKSLRDNHDAADVTQNTFVKAYVNLGKLKNPESFGAWLFAICNNEIRLFCNQKQKSIAQSIDIEDLENLPGGVEVGIADIEGRCGELHCAIDILDAKYRAFVILKYFARFSTREIAVLMGVDEKLVKSRLYDARRKLERYMSKNESSAMKQSMEDMNYEGKDLIMSTVKLMELGAHTVNRMSEVGKRALLKCARNNEKFTEPLIAELAKIDRGNEFAVECEGKLSYEELVKILACCDWGALYDFEDTHKIMRDVAAYLGIGGYIESIEAVLYVPSIKDTVNWYKTHLGWDSDFSREAEEYGHAIIHACPNEDSQYMTMQYRRFHLRSAGDAESATRCSFFIIVSHRQLELIRERVSGTGWEKVSQVYDSGFGATAFRVEDLNGIGLEFLEWRNF